ncbi:MFS transporter [Methylovirgula sp. 4M-Z18]|uniref:MFS transporter n=1 Tax=Methylovirgula sp. 4M-Z18 TaxID=2293567 RepID=UPI000E2EA5ED|nr:MFS transporter [Methylovirgula sp. 4M-Z18]RFB78722.1 MFS transporter [Methylovirgula sp. 4M-Z18]
MTDAPAPSSSPESPYWVRNLIVCLAGSFTTIVAMTLLVPFLPIYVEDLGVTDHAAIVQWSGVTFGATFLTAALVAPLWGRLADLYGRKLMLVRASLGMTIAMSLTGMAHNIWQLLILRLLTGLLGGYASGANVLVATQTPKARSGWALGMLSSGVMAGSLLGPLIGGALPNLIGIRQTFWLAGAVIFIAFLATCFLIKEERRMGSRAAIKQKVRWSAIPDKRPIVAMLLTGFMFTLATMSIEPIITVYVSQLVNDQTQVSLMSGVVMSAAAFGAILSASPIGKWADRFGHWNVVVLSLLAAVVLLIPQAFVTEAWQLVLLRFLMGMALGGLMPCITAVIRHRAPEQMAGTLLGYSISIQYAGQVIGPLLGGFVGGHLGMRAVFLATSLLLALAALYAWRTKNAD